MLKFLDFSWYDTGVFAACGGGNDSASRVEKTPVGLILEVILWIKGMVDGNGGSDHYGLRDSSSKRVLFC